MASKVCCNRIIELLEQGKPVFASGTIWNGNLDDLIYIADADYDAVIIEMEHAGFGFETLRTSLQYLLNRKSIAEKGTLQPDVVPLVRIPPNCRERDQWVIKQPLDTGVYGLMLPHLNSVEDAQAAVKAARYPQVPGVADFEPAGERGWGIRFAARYWGLSAQEYYDAADVWPLDPDGNILLIGIVEKPEGVKNLKDILRQSKGIGAIWTGPGDLSVAMGHRGVSSYPEVQEALLQMLATCKEFGVPAAVLAHTPQEVAMRLEQGYRIVLSGPAKSTPVAEARRLTGR